MANQKKRAKKTSQGIHGSGGKGRALTELELNLMGKGSYARFKPVGTDRSTQR